MKNKKIILGIAIAILLIAACVLGYVILEQNKASKVDLAKQSTDIAKKVENTKNNNTVEDELKLNGDKYNSADVTDKDNNTVTLEQEENKPMLMAFWNLDSMEVLNTIQSFYENYGEKVTFSAVGVVDLTEENRNTIDAFIGENNITIPVVYDSVEASASTSNNVSAIPTVLIINKDGEVINTVKEDNINKDVIEANLDIVTENY